MTQHQGQKLLSLGREVELPIRSGQERLLNDGLEVSSSSLNSRINVQFPKVDWLGSTDSFSSSPTLSWSLVYLFSGLALGSYLTYRYCSNK